jgi:hypothetical protein
MASLKDAERLTKDLEGLVGNLKSELKDGKGDFEKLVKLADDIGERADGIAETFSSINDTLMDRLNEIGARGGSSTRRSGTRESARSEA